MDAPPPHNLTSHDQVNGTFYWPNLQHREQTQPRPTAATSRGGHMSEQPPDPSGPFPLQSAPDNHQVVPAKHKLSTSFLIWKIQAAPSLGGNPSQTLPSTPSCFLGLPFPGGHLCHLRASPPPPAVSLACMLQAGAFGPRFSSRSPGKGPDKSLHSALNPVLRGPSAGSLFPQVSVHTQTVLSSPGMHWL